MQSKTYLDSIRAQYLADSFNVSKWNNLDAEDKHYLLYGTTGPIEYPTGPVTLTENYFYELYGFQTDQEFEIWAAAQLKGGVPKGSLGLSDARASEIMAKYNLIPQTGEIVYASGEPIFPTAPAQSGGQGSGQTDQTTGTTTGDTQVTTDITTASSTLMVQVHGAAQAALGRDLLNWDEWNWYYKGITGESAPSPEDRGYQRTSSGSVLIGTADHYAIETWWAAAFQTTVGGGAGGAGGGGNPSGGVPDDGLLTDSTKNLLYGAVAMIAAGWRGWNQFHPIGL